MTFLGYPPSVMRRFLPVLALLPLSAFGQDNAPPVLDSLSIGPDRPTADDVLRCEAGPVHDPDGDEVTVLYSWTVNGERTFATGRELSPRHFRRGDQVVCTGTPTDGFLEGEPVVSATVRIRNRPPVVGSVRLEPAELVTGEPVRCVAEGVADPDGDPVTLDYAWTLAGEPLDVSGPELDGGRVTAGDELLCTVTPHDGSDAGAPVASPPAGVGNAPPRVSEPVLSPRPAWTYDPLTCDFDAWDPDGDAFETSVRWWIDGVALDVEGPVLDPEHTRKGQEIACEVVATDATGSTRAKSASLIVENAPPSVDGAAIRPEVPTGREDLTCEPGEGADPDGDTVSFRFQWFVDDRPLRHMDQTLPARVLGRESRVYCVVTPIDGDDLGAPAQSAEVVVGNAAPVVADVEVDPREPFLEDPVTCTWGEVHDPDGDPVTLAITWTVNDVEVDETGEVLHPDDWKRGDEIRCVVTPHDGIARGAPVRSEPAVVASAGPVVRAARIEPRAPRSVDDLTCLVGHTEHPEGRPVEIDIAWRIDGAEVARGETLPASAHARGDEVACVVTPRDAEVTGRPVSSPGVVVANSPPVVQEVSLSPSAPATGESVTAEVVADDPDGDALTFEYTWWVDGQEVPAREAVLEGGFYRGQEIEVSVRPHDGTDAGEAVRSAPVVAVRAPLTRPRVRVTDPRAGRRDAVCRVDAGARDPGDDPVTFRFAWLRDGAPWEGATTTHLPGDTVPREVMTLGEQWTCTAQASVGDAEGPVSEPDTVLVVEAQVGAGSSHACALGTDGYVTCWGNWDYGAIEPPDEQLRDLAVGGWHNCAIRQRDRSVACWGHNVYGQSQPPSGAFQAIAAGSWHSCGIDLEGEVHCWGQEADGRTEAPAGPFEAITAGRTHTCGLRVGGEVECWGRDDSGETEAPAGRFVQVSAGERHTCAVDRSGAIRCWGGNQAGELEVPDERFTMVQAGARFTCGLRTDGRAQCWGIDNHGQLGAPEGAFHKLGRGVNSTCGWTREDTVACWGNDRYGQARPPRHVLD